MLLQEDMRQISKSIELKVEGAGTLRSIAPTHVLLLLSCVMSTTVDILENVFRRKKLASLSHNIYSSCLRGLLQSSVGNYVYQTSVSQDL